jgi:PKD repeat protein
MLRVGPDGALYYSSINFQTIYRVAWVGGATSQPVASATATPASGPAPLTVQFDATSSWDPDSDPLSFSWVFGDGGTSSLPAPTRSYPPGAYEPRVTVSDGSLSSTATLRVVSGNRPPVASILWPPDGATFDAGDVIPIEGVALDPEEGALGPVSLAWTVVFHHNTHTHPYLGPLSGIASASFLADETGETAYDVWYEIRLTATDAGAPVGASAWLSDVDSVNIFPNLATFTLATAPRPDLTLVLNGTPFAAPRSVLGVVRHLWSIEAPSPQQPGDGHTYVFMGWSDGGGQKHAIRTPPVDEAITANFGCDMQQTVSGLELASAPGGQITLTWDGVTDTCLAPGPIRYRIFEATSARPATLPGSFPLDPAFTLVAISEATSATLTPGPGIRYYLVTAVGSDLLDGPIGRYGH